MGRWLRHHMLPPLPSLQDLGYVTSCDYDWSSMCQSEGKQPAETHRHPAALLWDPAATTEALGLVRCTRRFAPTFRSRFDQRSLRGGRRAIRMDSVSDRFRSSAASDEVTDSGGQLVMDSYLYVFVIICHQGFRSFEALGVSQRSKRRREDDEVDHVLLLALCVSLCMLLRGWSLSDKHN